MQISKPVQMYMNHINIVVGHLYRQDIITQHVIYVIIMCNLRYEHLPDFFFT